MAKGKPRLDRRYHPGCWWQHWAKALGFTEPRRALVGSVLDKEPAAKAGIKDGDVILAVDGENIEDSAALLRSIADKHPGSNAVLTVWRDGKTQNITVTLGERKSQGATLKSAQKIMPMIPCPWPDCSPLEQWRTPGNGNWRQRWPPDNRSRSWQGSGRSWFAFRDVILKANQQPVSFGCGTFPHCAWSWYETWSNNAPDSTPRGHLLPFRPAESGK